MQPEGGLKPAHRPTMARFVPQIRSHHAQKIIWNLRSVERFDRHNSQVGSLTLQKDRQRTLPVERTIIMQVDFGATQTAQPPPVRRQAEQETHRPVAKTDEADLRRREDAERRSVDRQASEDDSRSSSVKDEGRRVDILA